ncbi:MAG: hypothetical protein J0H43_14980, partial [Actinobacteria bacterium]|nr:hypothetical protein [Actinomycetota bacterium]
MTDPISVVVTPNSGVTAWQVLKVQFSGSISNGHCAGDSFSFTVPPQLHPADGSTYPLTAPDGAVVATMTVHGQQVTVTLTSYVQTHQDVTLSGWLQAQIDASTAPGQTVDLNWTINGQTTTTPVQMGGCPSCGSSLPTQPAKWGSANTDGTLGVTIRAAVTTLDDEQVSFTDNLTSPGQAFVCPVTATTTEYSTLTAWGDPANAGPGPQATITTCTPTTITGSRIRPIR